ncbi:hypothetical protein [Bradyrhizobium sp. AS23.2]|uniref:hypothetical protein n=1 Tax=Bradyrhizobium sp. AS23.2 TaxID=1680155 RepID=UPI00093EEC62|nr:hypothetical protein [Bradyrhizobium sp. AS23.2]OKO74902.1 hypothetical protein AC630_25980 [Bradyrhizobium sp. AS23.2]
MREFKRLVKSTSSIATLAAGLLLLAAAPGNAGHHGDNNFGQGSGGDSKRATANSGRNDIRPVIAERRGGDKFDRKPTIDRARFDRGDKYGSEQDHKHEKWGRDEERSGDGRHKMAAPGSTTKTPGGKPVEAAGERSPQAIPAKPVATGSANAAGVTPPVNTIHPILSPPAGNVTVSNGVTKYEIPNGAGGVSAYSSAPGKITVTNGKDSVTLNGSSVTVSNALGVGAAQNNVQVGARNGEGKTVVSVAPTPKAPTTGGTGVHPVVTGFDSPDIKVGITFAKAMDGVGLLTYGPPAAAAYGLAKGGVKGAVHEVKETAEGIYDFFAW